MLYTHKIIKNILLARDNQATHHHSITESRALQLH